MAARILFLSDGKMMYYDGERAHVLQSERKAQYMNTVHDLAERNAWKYEGAGSNFRGQVNPYEAASSRAEMDCQVTDLVPCGEQVLYALTTPDMGGFYLRSADAADRSEGNWLAERNFRVQDMHLQGKKLVFALRCAKWEQHIALLDVGTTRYQLITQGDTCDTAPFLCEDGDTLYYASAGYARNEDGAPLAKGPSSLLRLSLRTGSLTEICADDSTDFLRPKEGPDGALYFIRRPYRQEGPKRLSIVDKVKNVGSFFKGVGKLLSIIGDPERAAKMPQIAGHTKEESQKRMLEGVLLDIAGTKNAAQEEDVGFVPDNWVLMRRDADGSEKEIQRGVADYDFDGHALVYTNGRRIIRLEDGKKTVLCKGVFIPKVRVWRS